MQKTEMVVVFCLPTYIRHSSFSGRRENFEFRWFIDMSSSSYTIFSRGATSVSSFPLPQAQQVWARAVNFGPRGNKS